MGVLRKWGVPAVASLLAVATLAQVREVGKQHNLTSTPAAGGRGESETSDARPFGPKPLTPPERAAIALRAGDATLHRLNGFVAGRGARSDELLAKHLQPLNDFFAERKAGTRAFADSLLGWRGKWLAVKGKVSAEARSALDQLIRERFAEHVFTSLELKGRVEQAVAAYLTELDHDEAKLLVDLRSDIVGCDPRALEVYPGVSTEQMFRAEYQKAVSEVLPRLDADLVAVLGREAASTVGRAVAGRVAGPVITALAVRAGLLGVGAGTGAVSFGIGFVVAILVDQVIQLFQEWTGTDSTTQVSDAVNQSLDQLLASIRTGSPPNRTEYDRLRTQEQATTDPTTRAEARAAADKIRRKGLLGLEYDLRTLTQLKAEVTRDAVKEYVGRGAQQ